MADSADLAPELDAQLHGHLAAASTQLRSGSVVPFLGAAVNKADRPQDLPKDFEWTPGSLLPDGAELAVYLAKQYDYPEADTDNLVRVSQFVALSVGPGPFKTAVRSYFQGSFKPTPVHTLLARLPSILEGVGSKTPFQLIVTTNYDDMMELAFEDEGQKFHTLTFKATSTPRGAFVHRFPDGREKRIDEPQTYGDIPIEDLRVLEPVILKIHGSFEGLAEDQSFVITEDDYIDYLTYPDISSWLPAPVAAKLKRSNFLFLGYGLRDWNLRVLLRRIWKEQSEDNRVESWAVQLRPRILDRTSWQKRSVQIFDVDLKAYVSLLEERLLADGP